MRLIAALLALTLVLTQMPALALDAAMLRAQQAGEDTVGQAPAGARTGLEELAGTARQLVTAMRTPAAPVAPTQPASTGGLEELTAARLNEIIRLLKTERAPGEQFTGLLQLRQVFRRAGKGELPKILRQARTAGRVVAAVVPHLTRVHDYSDTEFSRIPIVAQDITSKMLRHAVFHPTLKARADVVITATQANRTSGSREMRRFADTTLARLAVADITSPQPRRKPAATPPGIPFVLPRSGLEEPTVLSVEQAVAVLSARARRQNTVLAAPGLSAGAQNVALMPAPLLREILRASVGDGPVQLTWTGGPFVLASVPQAGLEEEPIIRQVVAIFAEPLQPVVEVFLRGESPMDVAAQRLTDAFQWSLAGGRPTPLGYPEATLLTAEAAVAHEVADRSVLSRLAEMLQRWDRGQADDVLVASANLQEHQAMTQHALAARRLYKFTQEYAAHEATPLLLISGQAVGQHGDLAGLRELSSYVIVAQPSSLPERMLQLVYQARPDGQKILLDFIGTSAELGELLGQATAGRLRLRTVVLLGEPADARFISVLKDDWSATRIVIGFPAGEVSSAARLLEIVRHLLGLLPSVSAFDMNARVRQMALDLQTRTQA